MILTEFLELGVELLLDLLVSFKTQRRYALVLERHCGKNENYRHHHPSFDLMENAAKIRRKIGKMACEQLIEGFACEGTLCCSAVYEPYGVEHNYGK